MATNRTTGVITEILTGGGDTSAQVSAFVVEILASVDPIKYTSNNLGGSGPRRSVFGVTSTLPRASGSSSRSMTLLLDGTTSNSGKPYMTTGTSASDKTLTFEILGLPRVITGYLWYQTAPVSPIEFAFEASNDGSAWTTLSAGDTMRGAGGTEPCTVRVKNTTAYKWYRLREVSGTWNDSNIRQVEFIISGTDDEVGNRSSSITATTNITGASGTDIGNLVDGAYGLNSSDSWWPDATSQSASGLNIAYQFDASRIIKYARVETSGYTGDLGTWKWQASDDGSTWVDIGSSFTWSVTNTTSDNPITIHDLSSNNTAYAYYQMVGLSGTLQKAPYYIETYFDISDGSSFDLEADFEDGSEFIVNHSAIEFHLVANLEDDSRLYAKSTVRYPLELSISYFDDSRLTAKASIQININPVVLFVDESRFLLSPLKVIAPVHLKADLTDASVFRATIFQGVSTPGPFYFAWVDAEDLEYNSSFLREDEDIFSLTLTQSEGDFARLSVIIKNPRVGLLAPSRKTWAWLTYYNGITVKPIFFGRLVGLPSNIFDTRVTLEFIARPIDFADQKEALAASMRELPYYDPIFIQPDSWDDPDLVLDARTELWHVDRVTHRLTTSDLIVPEDGVIELTEDDHLYSGLATSMGEVPARRCRVVATVPWTQIASGIVSLTHRLVNVWPKAPGGMLNYTGLISSFTFDGLSNDWPKEGAQVGLGWNVIEGSLSDSSVAVMPVNASEQIPGWGDLSNAPSDTFVTEGSFVARTTFDFGGIEAPAVTVTIVPLGWGTPVLTVGYDSSRNYSEIITVDVESDMQPILTLPGDDEVVTLSINTNNVSDMTRDGSTPLVDLRRNAFASTPRGSLAVQHMILMARATLINRSRAVQIDCHFSDFISALDVTLRKGLLIHDHRLPGGEASGKITKYSLSYAGGKPIAQVTINSTVGYGGAHTTNAGEDAYIDDDYIDDYFVRVNVIELVPSSDVAFSVPNYNVNDDGIDMVRGFNSDSAAKSIRVVDGPNDQRSALDSFGGIAGKANPDLAAYQVVLQNMYTQVHLTMVPIGKGPYATDIAVEASKLIIPKQIDLEAGAS